MLFINIFIYLNFLISTIAKHSWKKKKKRFKAASETVILWTVVQLFTFNTLQHSNFKTDKY